MGAAKPSLIKSSPAIQHAKKFVRFDSKLDSSELERATEDNSSISPSSSSSSICSLESKIPCEPEDVEDQQERRPKVAYKQLGFWIWFFAVFFLLLSLYLAFLQPRPIVRQKILPQSVTPVSLPIRLRELQYELTRPQLKIHMLWTTEPSTFKERNYKVIDSYFYHHPNAQLTIYASHLATSLFASYATAGYDIKVTKLDNDFLREMSNHCPGKQWIDSLDKWQKGRYYYTHITDYVRFCALYRWGGLYSDFDAIATQKLDLFENFIGRDSAQSNGTCNWCAWKQDIYLPPGVMAASKDHPLVKASLEIGFGGEYDPDIFNSVGPKAVTEAYNQLAKTGGFDVIKVLEQHELYPYNYLNSAILLQKTSDPRGKLDRLRRDTKSLHLYGHQTSGLDIHPESILAEAVQLFSVVNEKYDDFTLVGPSHLAVGRTLEEVQDIRIISPKKGSERWNNQKGSFKVTIATKYGKFKIAERAAAPPRKGALAAFDATEGSWVDSLHFSANSPAKVNRILSRLIYYSTPDLPDGRDQIIVTTSAHFSNNVDRRDNAFQQTLVIPVYDVTSLVTIIVKTVGRMDKVIALAQSTRKLYKTVHILVSDDNEHLFREEGMSREFYYLPLPADIGLSAGRNRMVQRVKTPYFLTLDDDFTLDATSQIGILLHALESTPIDGSRPFDIAGGKNPVDEGKFGLDFCGFMTIANKTLFLHEGTYGSHKGCNHVDFVPNIFLGRTSTFENEIQWDELLKVGEHEDFFLRAKHKGIKTLTCPGVTFTHDQVPHWLKRDAYEIKRSRVYDFWRLSLRKHGLEKINSFGQIMMDMINPPPVSEPRVSQILARSVMVSWTSIAPSFKVLYTEANKEAWRPVNKGQGLEYYGGNRITVVGLEANKLYKFAIYAGNRFSFEGSGTRIIGKTKSIAEEESLNMIENHSFENGHFNYHSSIGGVFHIDRFETSSGLFSGRIQILTRSYQARTPTLVFTSQTIDYARIKVPPLAMSDGKVAQMAQRTLVLSMNSKVERLAGWTSWRAELHIWFRGDDHVQDTASADIIIKDEFDMSVMEWQVRVLSQCLAPNSQIEKIEVRGALETYRGSVLWDDWVVIEQDE